MQPTHALPSRSKQLAANYPEAIDLETSLTQVVTLGLVHIRREKRKSLLQKLSYRHYSVNGKNCGLKI